MTSLDRAKRFLQNKGRTLALAAVPLAALTSLALPAKATLNFSFANNTCSSGSGLNANSNFTGGGCNETVLPQQGNFANAAGFDGNFSVMSNSAGQYGFASSWSDNGSGAPFTGTMPLSWDFTVTPTNSTDVWGWSINFVFGGTAVSVSESNLTLLTGTQTIQGLDQVTFSNAAITGLLVQFQVSQFATAGGESFTVDVPFGSTIDVNSAQGAPEPSTLVLLAAPLGYLLYRRRRQESI